MKKKISIIMALVLMLSTLLSINVSAATTGGANTQTIQVQTKDSWFGFKSITLSQNKATYKYDELTWRGWQTKEDEVYAAYKITIKNNTTGKIETTNWKDGSKKLTLDKNCSYTITVAYDWYLTWLNSNLNFDVDRGFKTEPSWSVSNASNILTIE